MCLCSLVEEGRDEIWEWGAPHTVSQLWTRFRHHWVLTEDVSLSCYEIEKIVKTDCDKIVNGPTVFDGANYLEETAKQKSIVGKKDILLLKLIAIYVGPSFMGIQKRKFLYYEIFNDISEHLRIPERDQNLHVEPKKV